VGDGRISHNSTPPPRSARLQEYASERQNKLLWDDVKNEFYLQGTCLLPPRGPPDIARLVRAAVVTAPESVCRRRPRPKVA
jgi:hypothetical protein